MSWNKSNLVLGVACVALAVPTLLQLSADAETFVDVGRIPLMFDGFTADNVGSIILGDPRDEQPEPQPDGRAQQVAYDQLALQLTDKGWTIGKPQGQVVELAGAPANKGLIEGGVFEHLRSIRNDPETLVQPGATDEQLAQYGLDGTRSSCAATTGQERPSSPTCWSARTPASGGKAARPSPASSFASAGATTWCSTSGRSPGGAA